MKNSKRGNERDFGISADEARADTVSYSLERCSFSKSGTIKLKFDATSMSFACGFASSCQEKILRLIFSVRRSIRALSSGFAYFLVLYMFMPPYFSSLSVSGTLSMNLLRALSLILWTAAALLLYSAIIKEQSVCALYLSPLILWLTTINAAP